MRYFKIAFLTLLGILSLSIITGFVLGYVYEDEVKKYVISELNKQLQARVIIDAGDIDLTLLKDFPYASLEFKNIKVLEAVEKERKDTLLTAASLSLRFNAIDIYNKNYKIKRINIKDVGLRLRIDKNGNDNYHFWKTSKDTANSSFSLDIQKILFDNVRLSYIDYQSHTDISLNIKKSEFSGKFNTDKYLLTTSGETYINHIRKDSTTYIDQKTFAFNFDLLVDNPINRYEIKTGEATLADLKLNVTGNVITTEYEDVLNLKLKGKDLNIKSVLSLLPENYKKKVNDFESEGRFYFESEIKGGVSATKNPSVSAKFGIKKASIIQNSTSTALKQVNLEGTFFISDWDKAKSNLDIKHFDASFQNGILSGKCQIENFDHPVINVFANADLNLEELQKFLSIDTIENIQGKLKLNISFIGELKDARRHITENFQTAKASGEMLISNCQFRLKNNPLNFDSIDASFSFNNNDVIINKLNGKISNSDVEVKGLFTNILAYVFSENAPLTVDATLKSKSINLDELMANKSSSPNSTYALRFSPMINFNLQSSINNVVFRRFQAKNVKGKLTLRDKKLSADSLFFTTMDGEIKCGGVIDASDNNKILIACDASIKKINIYKLFYQFENFGQKVIREKNLQGFMTADVQLASIWDSKLNVDLDKVYVKSNLTIEKGELMKFEAMKSLSSFIKISELENIKFSTLQNQIEIRNKKIYIPRMEIKSSALNLSCSGVHTFDNGIDYKVKILLSDLLFQKAKKDKKENAEFGVEEDDGLGQTNLFLSMTGTVDNPIIRYDRKSAVAKVKQDFKTERQNLKKILKEEFGWTKKDTLLSGKKQKVKIESEKFDFQWDENGKEKLTKDDDF